MTAIYTENVVQGEYRQPVKGADVFLLKEDGSLATTVGANPTVTDTFGFFTFTAADGVYLRDVRVAGVSYARDSIIIGSPEQFTGDTGPANSTYTSLAALKAAPQTNTSYTLATSAGRVDYIFVAGDYTGQADDAAIAKLDAVPLTTGALVRQAATGITAVAKGSGSYPRQQQQKNDDFINVLDKMTPADRAASAPGSGTYPDVTYAFEAAVATSKLVYVPPGNYGLVGHRPQNGVVLRGAGENCCFFKQLDPTKPAINALADVVTQGALIGVDYSGFCVIGHDAFATAYSAPPANAASAVFVGGYGPYAVTRSRFSYVARKTYRALELQGAENGNVYECYFDVTSEGTRAEAVWLNGGGYSEYNFFLTQCDTWAIRSSTGNSQIRCISENGQRYTGQMCEIWAVIEAIIAPTLPADSQGAAFYDEGYCNVYHSPTLNLIPSDVGKVTFAFRPFYETIYHNPQIIGPAKPVYPFAGAFYPFTLSGGRGSAAGQIETYYDGSSDNRNMRRIRMLAASPDLTSYRPGWRRSLLADPGAAGYTMGVDEMTGTIFIQPTVDPLPTLTVIMGAALYDGFAFTFKTTKAITSIVWPAGVQYSMLPTSLAAGASLTPTYSKAADRFLPF